MAFIQSSNLGLVHRIAERLRAGGVYVNGAYQIHSHTPFGGVGISGFGKEGGRAGLDEFLRYKTVAIASKGWDHGIRSAAPMPSGSPTPGPQWPSPI